MPATEKSAAKVIGEGQPSKMLARRIRALRNERNWTLETASSHIGLSRSALSKIERHEMSPTFNALNKLAQGFGISMTRLLEIECRKETGKLFFTHSDQGTIHTSSQYKFRAINTGLVPASRLVIVEFVIDTRDISAFDDWDRHDDENIVYILDGTVQFHQECEAKPITLNVGDSICFDARKGHAFTSLGNCAARALSVSVPV